MAFPGRNQPYAIVTFGGGYRNDGRALTPPHRLCSRFRRDENRREEKAHGTLELRGHEVVIYAG